jgi:type IV pilus assembly protein PilV
MYKFQKQTGATLLEVLVAIVIFSLGILGILGLQASTAGVGADARFRTEASALADELIAKMQVWEPANVVTDFSGDTTGGSVTGGGEFTAWYNGKLKGTNTRLPNAQAVVTVGQQAGAAAADAGYIARVNIRWFVPSSKENTAGTLADYSQFETVAGIVR